MEEHKEHKTHKKEESVTISKSTLWKAISGILAVLLVVSIYTGGFGREGTTKTVPQAAPAAAAPSAPSPQPRAPINMEALADDDAFKGDPDAPVTIVEFSDFECPFCARFYSQTLAQIDEQYIKTGKVKFVYRDFPLSFHPQAQKSAEAAECAGEQDQFFAMHDKLFEEGVSGGVASFKQFAADIGLDTKEFNTCLDSGAMAGEVAKDMQDGQAAGIRGTPGFIINGQLVSGAQPFANFKQIIDAELAK